MGEVGTARVLERRQEVQAGKVVPRRTQGQLCIFNFSGLMTIESELGQFCTRLSRGVQNRGPVGHMTDQGNVT